MSTRKSLLIGVSVLALTVGAAATGWADQNFTANSTATATAGGNDSDQKLKNNKNENIGDAFLNAQGVISEVQNNGDNAAITNGNTVDAKISTGVNTGNVNYSATSTQTATQVGGSESTEIDVNDDNVIEDQSFRNAEGVISKVQNNGADSAINNGNTVAAAILEGTTGNAILKAESRQTATVTGGPNGNIYSADPSTNDNDIRDSAFQNTEGVMSAAQNNGPNSAINNGNTVSGIIGPGTVSGNRTFDTDSRQTATVNGGNASTENPNVDNNRIRNQAFQNAEGVGSALQNNGANSAANNGNTVSAVVSDNSLTGGNNDFDTNQLLANNQAAKVDSGAALTNSAVQTDSPDTNSIANDAFEQAEGVFSALQNNGPNSASNNGNTVSAIIANGSVGTGSSTFDTDSQQTATVDAKAGGANSSDETDSADSNTISQDAFRDGEGVFSALQNNGANSAANNGNTVSAVISDGAVSNGRALFGTDSSQSATVQASDGGNTSEEDPSPNTNTVTNNAFASSEGIVSALQNNGANSALNNGNTVSAIITNSTTNSASNDQFSTDSTQTARVLATGVDGRNTNSQTDTDDTNTISGAAFDGAEGVMSALQNNGANSAANNGNTVSAIVADGAISDAGGTLRSDSAQTARVDAGDRSLNQSIEVNSDDRNTMTGTSFQDATGIGSALQNNGANSALNNGNTVSAFVGESTVSLSTGTATFDSPFANLNTTQSATVEATDSGGSTDGNRNVENLANGATNTIDENTMTSEAFENAHGVFSALQNNGPNSAINNGNTVSAIIADGTVGTATANFETTSSQNALVTNDGNPNNEGGRNESNENRGPSPASDNPDRNTISSEAFRAAKGVFSAGQNNGANSAINNGNTVSAIITDGNVNTTNSDILDATSTQNATVQSLLGSVDADGNKSFEVLSSDNNTVSGSAFRDASGVASVFQNNGANSALNNGNAVSAVITDGRVNSRANFNADSRQVARVTARQVSRNDDSQGQQAGPADGWPSPETNLVSTDAFQNAEGVFSVLQNNGANSAVNNGNTVAAFIADGSAATIGLDNSSLLDTNKQGGFTDTQSATVEAGDSGSENRSRQLASNETNRIINNAFQNAEGVVSALQNNGGNSALNNGNTVAAVVAQNGISGNQNSTFQSDSTQSARVNAVAGENLSIASDTNGRGDSESTNTLTNNVFNGGEGVFSVLQNNGPNTAANNGNAVSAFIADGSVDVNGANTFTTNSSQTARVDATGVGGMNTSTETDDSDDTNTINSAAFSGTQGVVSVLQNNGPNSAINNGNTVAAIINSCGSCTGTFTFASTSSQSSIVVAGTASATHSINSDNTNTIGGSAFSGVAGVYSITQNNAPNAAISNGNTVSAVIVNN